MYWGCQAIDVHDLRAHDLQPDDTIMRGPCGVSVVHFMPDRILKVHLFANWSSPGVCWQATAKEAQQSVSAICIIYKGQEGVLCSEVRYASHIFSLLFKGLRQSGPHV